MIIMYLIHHGIKGQKWGIRRFQNEDGTLTEDGKNRYTDFAKEARSKATDAYYNRLDGPWHDDYEKNPDYYENRMKTKKYKDLADFVDSETKQYKDEALAVYEKYKNTKNKKEKQKLWDESTKVNDKYWNEYFTVAEQYITEFFGKTEKERNKGRDFIYDHSGLWW